MTPNRVRLAIACSCLYLFGGAYGANVSFPDTIETVVTQFSTIIENQIVQKLPASTGDCTVNSPPTPCQETGKLYEDSSSLYKVQANWVAGLNTLKLVNSQVIAPPAGAENQATTLRVTAQFKELPLDLRAEGCVPLTSTCTKVAEGTDYCCQGPVNVTVNFLMGCSTSSPHFTSLTVASVSINPELVVKKTIAGINIKIKDITGNVETAVKDALNKAVTSSNVTDQLNSIMTPLFQASTIVCTSLKGQAQDPTPSPTPSSALPANTLTLIHLCLVLSLAASIVWSMEVL